MSNIDNETEQDQLLEEIDMDVYRDDMEEIAYEMKFEGELTEKQKVLQKMQKQVFETIKLNEIIDEKERKLDEKSRKINKMDEKLSEIVDEMDEKPVMFEELLKLDTELIQIEEDLNKIDENLIKKYEEIRKRDEELNRIPLNIPSIEKLIIEKSV